VLRTLQPSMLPAETLLSLRDGSTRFIADSAAPIRSTHNEIIGVVLVFRDVTEEREIQTQLQHSQRMDAIGQLAGGVAHDFNNMLTGMGGAVELLEMTLGDNHPGQKFIRLIKNATERAAGLTRKLLDFSRRGKRLSTPVNVHTIIEDVIAILERSIDKRIVIRTELQAEQVMVIGDPSQLQSGILNICINARDAMPDGGEIYILTKNLELTEQETAEFQTSERFFIQISIQDTGTGIPPEVQPYIFEPFYTTKEVGKGTGLGLAAVYGMVKEHYGDVRVYSEGGMGTVFHLYLPVSVETSVWPQEQSKPVIHGSGTILIVDDEDIIRTTASLFLENLGYTVILAKNGQEGVETYRNHQNEIDLVILDMIMPVMDGKEAFDRMTTINPEVKVIISSGYAKEMHLLQKLPKKPIDFLSKPFNHFELSKLIAEILAG